MTATGLYSGKYIDEINAQALNSNSITNGISASPAKI